MGITKIIVRTKNRDDVILDSSFKLRYVTRSVTDETQDLQLSNDRILAFYYEEPTIATGDTRARIVLAESIKYNSYKEALSIARSYVASLNGVTPTHDGFMFINGSMCTSVGHAEDYNENNHELTIEDFCPSCITCKDYILLLKTIEYYKMVFNYIKDLNLYEEPLAKDRFYWLNNNRAVLDATCINEVKDELTEVSQLPPIKGVAKLMKEYLSTIHLWNYAVNMSGAHTKIISAPGEPSGFVVQTLRALPSCKGNLSVEVQINVSGPTKCNDDYISMYIPDPLIEFLPENSIERSDDAILDIYNDPKEHTTKRITYTQSNVVGAGSLCITARFLPFTAMKLFKKVEGKRVEITVDKLLDDVIDAAEESGSNNSKKVTYFLEIEGENYSVAEPTVTMYNDSRRYPSITKTRDPLRFTIDIYWAMYTTTPTGGVEKLYSIAETYYFDCRPLRKCITDLWKNLEAIVTEDEEDE